MGNYKLYGEVIIENDSTLESFALSLIKAVPEDDLIEAKSKYERSVGDTEYEDEFMERVRRILTYDISRTDIDYSSLMKKYASEIGPVLYDMDNRGWDLSSFRLSFFGESARECFNRIVEYMVWNLKFIVGCEGNSQLLHELKLDIKRIMSKSVSSEYSGTILNLIEKNIIEDVMECSAFKEEGIYSEDDIRMAIGRVLTDKLESINHSFD